jgi:hypothetical protein
MNMTATTLTATDRPSGIRATAQRLARFGFWFFLIKGLLWLVAPLLAWQAIS